MWQPWQRSSEWHINPSPHSPNTFMGPPQRSSGPLAQTLLLQAFLASPKTQSSTGGLSHSSIVMQGIQGDIKRAASEFEVVMEIITRAVKTMHTRIFLFGLLPN